MEILTKKKIFTDYPDEISMDVLPDNFQFREFDHDFEGYFFKQHFLVMDFSQSPVAFCLFARRRREHRVLNIGYIDKSESAIEMPRHFINKCLGALSIKYNLRDLKVLIIINSHDFFLRRISVPRLRGKALRKAILWNGAKQIPYPIEEAYVNVLKIEKTGAGSEVLIAAARKNLVDKYAFLRDKLLGVVPSAVALTGNFLDEPAEGESTNIIIYWDYNEAFINYLNNGILEFSQGFKLTPPIVDSAGKPTDFLTQKISDNLKTSIDFYTTAYPGQRVENISLLGPHCRSISERLRGTIDINIKPADLLETRFGGNTIGELPKAAGEYRFLLQSGSINLPGKYKFVPSAIGNLQKLSLLKSAASKASAIILLIVLLLSSGFWIEKNYREGQLNRLNDKIETVEKSRAYREAARLRDDITSLNNSIFELKPSGSWASEMLRHASFGFPAEIHLTNFTLFTGEKNAAPIAIRLEGYYKGDIRKADVTLANMIEDLSLYCGASFDRLDRISETVGLKEKYIKFVLTGTVRRAE